MPTYNVPVTRDVTETTTWRVEADNPEEAIETAVKKARQFGQTGMLRFERDDCTNMEREVYFAGDPSDLELIADNDENGQCKHCGRDNSDYRLNPCSADCPLYDEAKEVHPDTEADEL
ncbi:hypothetical protein [Sphingomonas jaspsi]|uniref:hypothetical protein n=1 Tax=Sphingomonas jaspsi TaxID=392409 RepID=UPI0004BC9CBE|nr:hypothetical protein [Sphingomonas jaspsi]